MKKTILAVFALLAVFACSKKEMDIQTPEQEVDNTPMSFNLSVNPMNGESETKSALKEGWSNGDVVYVFFDAIPTKYIKKSYDGSTWTDSFPGGAFVAGDFSADGPAASRYMTAVWLPKEMGEVTVTYADSKFSFTIGGEKIYSHYMSVHPSYNVSGTTISGTLNMAKPSGFVQFFVPGITAADAPTYRLMESHLTPKACDYVALAGGVAESARTAGYSIKGAAFTSDESVTGALFGGYLSSAGVATAYEFSLVKEISVAKPAALGTYTLKGTKTIASGTSMTLPDISNVAWGTMSPFVDLGFGDILWATGNLKETSPYIEDPLAAGDYYKWGYTTPYDNTGTTDPYDSYKADAAFEDTASPKNSAWSMPNNDQFGALINSSNTTSVWEDGWTSIGGSNGGYLITSKVNGISLFFAASGLYSDGLLDRTGIKGFYWSSSPRYDPKYYFAYDMDFYNGKIETYFLDRTLGFSVRPVKAAAAPAPSAPTGAINGLFTVNSSGDQVYFSQGNLQATTTDSWNTWTFSFMEHQYSTVETASQNVGSYYASQNTVSLFGWGTSGISGYTPIAGQYWPNTTGNDNSGYYAYDDPTKNLYDESGKADWGYNAISNGGNTVNSGWRTLTKDEWTYLFANHTYGAHTVHSQNGIIVLPDGVSSATGFTEGVADWTSVSDENWATMEAAGAVFLPAAGYRSMSVVYEFGDNLYYWSSTCKPEQEWGMYNAYCVFFYKSGPYFSAETPWSRCQGFSVRLVKNAN